MPAIESYGSGVNPDRLPKDIRGRLREVHARSDGDQLQVFFQWDYFHEEDATGEEIYDRLLTFAYQDGWEVQVDPATNLPIAFRVLNPLFVTPLFPELVRVWVRKTGLQSTLGPTARIISEGWDCTPIPGTPGERDFP